jgi:hypothetical protein
VRDYIGESLEKAAACGQTIDARPMQLIEQYQRELAASRANTARVEELIALLERNPDTKRLLELMGGRY